MKELVLPGAVLKEAVPGLSKLVSKRATLPLLQTVRLTRDAGGRVMMTGTDLDAYVTYTAKEPVPGPELEMLVPLSELAKILKPLTAASTVAFIPESKDKVKLRYSISGNVMERVIPTPLIDEFPAPPKLDQQGMRLEGGFGLALRQALQCCSGDHARRILQGVCLDVSDKKYHYVVATNGSALFTANSFCFDLQKSVVIPDSKFLTWTDFLDQEPASLTVEPGVEAKTGRKGERSEPGKQGWIKLESGPWTYITKEIDGIYPNWKQVIPTPNKSWTKVNLSEEAVQQLLLVTPNLPGDNESNHTIRLGISDQVVIEGRNRDEENWTGIPVQGVKVAGKSITIGLNREYLLTGLRFGLNELEIQDKLSPMILSAGGKRMVIMPINLDPPPPTSHPVPTPPPTPEPASQPDNEAQNEERSEMPRTKTAAADQAPVETQATNSSEVGTGVKSLVDHVESIKDTLRSVIRDLAGVVDGLKQAEREKKVTEREIETIRTKLKQIQNVTI